MFQVDNSGKGNCMYYAYSISLMYFLRAKNIPEVAEDIFNILKLEEEGKIRLRTLLSGKPDQEFSSFEIKSIIEPILGNATRTLAAEYTKKEFKNSPQDAPLFSSAHYGLEFCFKCSMELNRSELSYLIDHGFNNRDYISAEIYKVKGIDMAMQEYSLARLPAVLDEFHHQWNMKELELIEQKKELNEHEIQEQKATVLDNILRKETVAFFLGEEEKYLNQYVHHLQQAGVWGSEETLFVLHRAIQGEHRVRNEEGSVHFLYDREIILHLYRNDMLPYSQPGSPEMIVNNQYNTHWTSMIPESIFVLKYSPLERKLYQLLDDMLLEYGRIPLESSEWIHTIRTQLHIISDNPEREAKEKALNDSMHILSSMMPILANYPYWRALFVQFFSALLECIPIFMEDKKISAGLVQCESLIATRQRPKTTSEPKNPLLALDEHKELSGNKELSEMVSNLSQHSLFKQPTVISPKIYPEEIAHYVREHKQTGPGVAKALRQMHEEGCKGNEAYSPEKCKEIAQRYIAYVKYQQRNFVLTDVVLFIQDMDKLIKQKEQDDEELIEHINDMKYN